MKKLVAILLCAVLLVSTMSGCTAPAVTTGSEEAATDSTAAPVTEGETASAPEEMTLRFMTVYTPEHPFGPAIEQLITEFETNNPGVTIEREFMPGEEMQKKLAADLASDNLPDISVIYVKASEGDKAKAGKIIDLTQYLDADPEWKDGFIAGALDNYRFDGIDGVYGVPVGAYCIGYYYNKELFQKAGAEVPKTWDDLLAVIEKLKAIDVTPIALGAKDTWRNEHFISNLFIKHNGATAAQKLGTRELQYSSPEMIVALNDYVTLGELGAFGNSAAGIDYATEIAMFNNGEAAMRMSGPWSVGEIKNSGDEFASKIGYFPVPYYADKPEFKDDWMGGTSDAFAVSSKLEGAKLEMAIKFVKYLTSAPAAKLLMETANDLTAIKADVDPAKTSTLFNELTKAMATGKAFGGEIVAFEPVQAAVQKFQDVGVSVLTKQLTPEEAMKQVEIAITAE